MRRIFCWLGWHNIRTVAFPDVIHGFCRRCGKHVSKPVNDWRGEW